MIIKTIDQFAAVIPTAVSVSDFKDLETYVRSAQVWLKNNVLGTDLYKSVDESQESSGGADQDLLALCQNVVANHAYYGAIPFLDLVHTNNGFGVVKNNNTAPASKERVERLRDQCLVRRDEEVENLIDFLEEHSEYHDLWKTSPAFTILSDCLITTAKELEQYAEWQGTRKEFLKLRPKLIQKTVSKLEPVFSKDYIEELIEKQRDDDISGDNLRVLIMLKQSLGGLITGNFEAAEHIAGDALRYIDNNPENFSTYFESSEYEAWIAEGYTNNAEDPIFSSLF